MSSSSSNSNADFPPPSKERQRMRSEAEEALAANPQLDCPGFESSRVFALLDKLLQSSTTATGTGTGTGGSGFSKKALLRNINTVFQFVVLPTVPIDQSNPRTRPTKKSSGGALRPALWYVDLKKTAAIAKGYPPKGILGVRKKADVTIECTDRDLLHMAQGQQHPQKLYNVGRIKIKGDIDRALRIASLLNSERSRLFGVPPAPGPAPEINNGKEGELSVPNDNNWQREGNAQAAAEYGSGAPAPIPDRAKL